MIITIDYLGVLLAAIAAFAFGALWHSNFGFGGTWRSLMGFKESDMHKMPLTPAQAMLLGFIATVLFAYVLAHFVALAGAGDAASAMGVGFWVWLGFVVVTVANGWLWEGKSVRLFLFNCAYQLLAVEIMAAIIGIVH